MRIAILDIRPGIGIDYQQVEGLEDMLTAALFNSGYFIVIERSRINEVISANDFYRNELTEAQYIILAEKMQVDAVLVGTINYIISDRKLASDGVSKIDVGEYNIDLRLIGTTGELLSSAGVSKVGKTQRELMNMASWEIVRNLSSSVREKKTIQILYDYLYVYPEDLGTFTTKPTNIIAMNNRNNSYGYSDWRIPTLEEVQILQANATMLRLDKDKNYAYDTNSIWDSGNAYNVRLVRTKVIVQQRLEQQQRAYFEDIFYDYGTIPILNGIVTTRFCLQNPSTREVRIQNVTKTDSHLIVNWERSEIPSGGKSFVTVSYNPNGRVGVSFRNQVIVTLSDGQRIELIVSGQVR